jgi:hypothetical protein
MEPGFVADRTHHGKADEQRWVEGAPERSIWTGIRTKGREVFGLETYRCEQCGYLESYARTPAKL